jgi:hypothetical protein
MLIRFFVSEWLATQNVLCSSDRGMNFFVCCCESHVVFVIITRSCKLKLVGLVINVCDGSGIFILSEILVDSIVSFGIPIFASSVYEELRFFLEFLSDWY